MEDEEKINIKDYFGETRPIDYVKIALIVILIAVMIYYGTTTECTLDCSMCKNTGQVLVQKGLI